MSQNLKYKMECHNLHHLGYLLACDITNIYFQKSISVFPLMGGGGGVNPHFLLLNICIVGL